MKINVADIIKVQDAIKKVSIIEPKVDMPQSLHTGVIVQPVQLQGELKADGGYIHLSGILKTEVKLPCDRCMCDVICPIETEVAESFGQVLSEEEEEDIKPIVHSAIDLSSTIMETIMVSLPMKVLCDTDCKGICSVCGENLNEKSCECNLDYIDPRLEKFNLLFKDNN